MSVATSVARFNQVTKIFSRSHLGRVKKSTALENLSLEIRAGEVFGLLGLNGAGKTTSIKLLLGLLYPTMGSIEVFGQTMPRPEALRRVGYLPEAAYVNRYLTGREAVTLFARLGGLPRSNVTAAVTAILDKVGMTAAAERRISECSKGMMQRISMAQALVHEPDLLVMDEPVTGLDPLAINELRQLILWLKHQGKTVFFSSHSISEVERVCDRIAILAGGRLVATMEAKEWSDRPGHLEEIFTSTVRRTEGIGTLKFGEVRP